MIQLVLIYAWLIQAAVCSTYQQPLLLPTKDVVSLKSIYNYHSKQDIISSSSQTSTQAFRFKSILDITWQLNEDVKTTWSQTGHLRIRNMPTKWPFHPAPYLVPDVQDYNTILSLAEMSYNAYTDFNKSDDWYDLGTGWKIVKNFTGCIKTELLNCFLL